MQKDRDAAAQSFAKAIENLKKAKQNTRFFPNLHYDEAVHDTYYYTALSYHKLYQITKKNAILNDANLAWREYFDFFPKNLEGNSAFEETRAVGAEVLGPDQEPVTTCTKALDTKSRRMEKIILRVQQVSVRGSVKVRN